MGRAFEYRRAAKEKRWGHMSRMFPKLARQITAAAKEGIDQLTEADYKAIEKQYGYSRQMLIQMAGQEAVDFETLYMKVSDYLLENANKVEAPEVSEDESEADVPAESEAGSEADVPAESEAGSEADVPAESEAAEESKAQ